jgi:hypothetical protein
MLQLGVIMAQKEKTALSTLEITLNCSGVLSYGVLQNKTSPIKRLYVKNTAQTDEENIVIKVYSTPDFLLPVEIEQTLLPRHSTTKFEIDAKLSPLFLLRPKNAQRAKSSQAFTATVNY